MSHCRLSSNFLACARMVVIVNEWKPCLLSCVVRTFCILVAILTAMFFVVFFGKGIVMSIYYLMTHLEFHLLLTIMINVTVIYCSSWSSTAHQDHLLPDDPSRVSSTAHHHDLDVTEDSQRTWWSCQRTLTVTSNDQMCRMSNVSDDYSTHDHQVYKYHII